MNRSLYLLLLLSYFLTACEDLGADINVEPGESKIVLVGFIAPSDTMIRINVSQTQPLLGDLLDATIRNAKVTISDGLTIDTLVFSVEELNYISYKRIQGGTHYTIRAELPDGRWAEAECTTPDDVSMDFRYTIDSVIDGNTIEYTVKMNWTDGSMSPVTYYRTDAEMYYLIVDTINQHYEYISTELKPNVPEISLGTGFNTEMEVIYKSNFETRFVEKFLELHLLMIDKDYHEFEKSKKNNYSGFPNYEYTKLYSNVKNGYGIVASYNNYVLKSLNVY